MSERVVGYPMLNTYCITDSCRNGVVAVAAIKEAMPRNEYGFFEKEPRFTYLLQNKEHAAAEKQLAIQVPTEPIAGNAMQLKAAPIAFSFIERKRNDRSCHAASSLFYDVLEKSRSALQVPDLFDWIIE